MSHSLVRKRRLAELAMCVAEVLGVDLASEGSLPLLARFVPVADVPPDFTVGLLASLDVGHAIQCAPLVKSSSTKPAVTIDDDWPGRVDAFRADPRFDLADVEADEPADLEVRDAPLLHESADESFANAKPVGETVDVQQTVARCR